MAVVEPGVSWNSQIAIAAGRTPEFPPPSSPASDAASGVPESSTEETPVSATPVSATPVSAEESEPSVESARASAGGAELTPESPGDVASGVGPVDVSPVEVSPGITPESSGVPESSLVAGELLLQPPARSPLQPIVTTAPVQKTHVTFRPLHSAQVLLEFSRARLQKRAERVTSRRSGSAPIRLHLRSRLGRSRKSSTIAKALFAAFADRP